MSDSALLDGYVGKFRKVKDLYTPSVQGLIRTRRTDAETIEWLLHEERRLVEYMKATGVIY